MSITDRIREAWAGWRAAAPGAGNRDAARILNADGSMSLSEFAEWVKGTSTGQLSPTSAMSISTVYACVSLIGGAVASIPLHTYRRTADGERERVMQELWWLLNEAPFPCWPAATAWEYSCASLLLQGDAFLRIHRASRLSPNITGFEPLHPGTVEVTRVGERLAYRISSQPSQSRAPGTVTLDQDDVLHVAGPGFDGLRGLSQIASALRVAGGNAAAADEYVGRFYKNGARPDFVLESEKRLDSLQVEQIRQQWVDRYGGTANAFKPAILSGGLVAKPITINAKDSQLIEERKFGVEEICRIFGVPPHLVGHTQASTSWGTGIEQMSLGFVKYTLQRHLVKFEQEINRKVFRTAARFCEFNTAGLERGDFKSRMEGYRIAVGRAGEPGWMTTNEIRRLENLPPVEGGDTLAGAEPAEGTGNEKQAASAAQQ